MSLALSQYALPLFIALFGLESKSLTFKGALSAVLLSYIILLRQNMHWFAILFSFYIIGTFVTRLRKEEKRKHSLIQKTRGPWNVVGNAGMAMLMALLGGLPGLIGFVGAISTATADTISSEVGVLSKSPPRLVTNLKKVPAGTNGAITILGTFSGALGTFAIGTVALLEAGVTIIPVAVISGVIGCFADSYIGIILENRGVIGNSTTNFLATATGATSSILIYFYLFI